jgi:hypothetical protein
MDVVPPPVAAPAEPSAETASAPIPVSPEIASQMTDHPESVAPAPEPTPGPGAAAASEISPVAAPVDDDTPPPTDAGDSPHELIEQKPSNDKPAEIPAEAPSHTPAAPIQAPTHHDATHTAIIATVVITVVLSLLVVMAYMSSNKA